MPPDLQSAGLEAGAVGACSTCLITIGFDPLWAPVAATVGVFLGRLVAGLIEARLKARKESTDGKA